MPSIRLIEAIIWTLDDGPRLPLEVHKEALELACRDRHQVYERVAKTSETLAENVRAALWLIKRVSDELLNRMTRSAVAWWKTVAPPPTWMPEAMQVSYGSLPTLLKALEIDRLPDCASNDPRDLQNDAVLNVGEYYNRKMNELGPLIPTSFDFTPMEASFGVPAELKGKRWEFLLAARHRLAQRLILQLLPLVSGFDAARQARDGYRRTFAHREAKKRGGTGGRHARAAGTEDPKVVDVSFDKYLNLLAASDASSLSLDAERIMRLVKKHLGSRAVILLKALAEGKQQKLAAKAARVTDRTARNYIAKMRRLLAE